MLEADQRIFTVSTLTRAVKGNLEANFPFIWVRGQVTNVSRPSSGHVYFTLRDEYASLNAVWFKQNQGKAERFNPLTGEVYEEGPRPCLAQFLENGQEILCAGRLTVYEARGSYQLLVELAEPAGLGRLQEEFKKLQLKLETLGYFNLDRKRPLPKNPQNIAVVTSPHGAAIHDFITVSKERGLSAKIRVYPAQVQGDGAEVLLAQHIDNINQEKWADVIVLVRGGGSLEDLWCFNTEILASSIFKSSIPVIAGIGHQTDFTLADLTADVRAATPSHAAQLLFSERKEFYKALDDKVIALQNQITKILDSRLLQLSHLHNALGWQSPAKKLHHWRELFTNIGKHLEQSAYAGIWHKMEKVKLYQSKMNVALQMLPHKKLLAQVLSQKLLYIGQSMLYKEKNALQQGTAKLAIAKQNTHKHKYLLENLNLRLEGNNPLAPLEKGYAIVSNEHGEFIKNIAQTHKGQNLFVSLKDGKISVLVTGEDNA